MTLEQFKEAIEIVPKKLAVTIKAQYLEAFIDTDSAYYRNVVSKYKQFSDGLCHEGYLWDCLIKPFAIITFNQAATKLKQKDRVFVFWDLHSRERILTPNYWKFKKTDILHLDTNVLLKNLAFLPEDIYIFDELFEWTIILTHEENYERKERICVEVQRKTE